MNNIEDATIIPPKAVAEYSLKDAALQELSKVEAGLGELKTNFAGKTYDVTNALGMAQAKQARMTIREIRYRIPKIIDEKKALIKAAIKEMEASGAKITEELFALENPIHKQIDDEETRKKEEKQRKEEEARLRLQNITEAIEKIKLIPIRCATMTSEQLTEQIAFVEAIVISETFYGEFRPSATEAKTNAYQELVDLKNVALQLEQETAERLQREKEEREEQERLQEEERQRLADQQKEIDRQNEELRLQREQFQREQEEQNRQKEERENQERIEREQRDQAEREQREAEEKRCETINDRISLIRLFTSPADTLEMIQAKIDHVEAVQITAEDFAEFIDKAAAQKEETLASLSFAYVQLKQHIEREAEFQRQRDELKKQQDEAAEEEAAQQRERNRLAGLEAELRRQENEKLEELKNNHDYCGCPFCQGKKV